MPTLPLDAYLSGDDSIKLDSTQALRIRQIGTDKSAALTPSIAGQDLGDIRQNVAATNMTGSQEQGLLDLGDLFYAVPPERELSFDGAGGDVVRIKGERLDGTSPGNIPSDLQQRFETQGDRHRTYVRGTGSTGTDVSLSDGEELQVFTLTPETDERYVLDGTHMVSVANYDGTLAGGDLSLIFEIDGQRMPSQFGVDDAAGIDVFSLPDPPTDSTEAMPFRYQGTEGIRDGPVLEGDETIRVLARNISGGTLSPTSGNSLDVTYTAGVDFSRGGA